MAHKLFYKYVVVANSEDLGIAFSRAKESLEWSVNNVNSPYSSIRVFDYGGMLDVVAETERSAKVSVLSKKFKEIDKAYPDKDAYSVAVPFKMRTVPKAVDPVLVHTLEYELQTAESTYQHWKKVSSLRMSAEVNKEDIYCDGLWPKPVVCPYCSVPVVKTSLHLCKKCGNVIDQKAVDVLALKLASKQEIERKLTEAKAPFIYEYGYVLMLVCDGKLN